MSVSYMMRIKIVASIVICFLIWQIVRHLSSFSEFSNQGLSQRWETMVPSTMVPPILITVFYEALCPDSRSFFTKQLLPTFEKIPHLIQINLVPYGKAKTEKVGDSYNFSCQHGPLECQANKIHACAIAKVTQPDILLKYTTCMISNNMSPEKIGEECAQEHGVRWKLVAECAAGMEGDELLKHHGEATNALYPRVSFIPTVLLDQNQDNQPAILKNLLKEVCARLQEQVGSFPFTLEALLQKACPCRLYACRLDTNICLHVATHVAALYIRSVRLCDVLCSCEYKSVCPASHLGMWQCHVRRYMSNGC